MCGWKKYPGSKKVIITITKNLIRIETEINEYT